MPDLEYHAKRSVISMKGLVLLLQNPFGKGLVVVGHGELYVGSERLEVLPTAVDLRLLCRPEGVSEQTALGFHDEVEPLLLMSMIWM